MPLQRLHVFAHSRDLPTSCHKIMVSSTFHQIQNNFSKLKCIVCSAFWKANILKVELSMMKIGELLRKLWSLRSCFPILPPGALTPQGIEGAMKRDVINFLVSLPVMCHQRLNYCTWELNVTQKLILNATWIPVYQDITNVAFIIMIWISCNSLLNDDASCKVS